MAASTANAPPSQDTSASSIGQAHGTPSYETFNTTNAVARSNQNNAAGPMHDVKILDQVRSIKLDEIQNFHRKPCVRDALLAGISSGFAVGGVRAVLGAPLPRAANWAVGGMVAGSIAAYEFCQYRRRKEIQGMKLAVEVMETKRQEHWQRLKEAQDAKQKAEEERIAEQKRQQRRWWKVW